MFGQYDSRRTQVRPSLTLMWLSQSDHHDRKPCGVSASEVLGNGMHEVSQVASCSEYTSPGGAVAEQKSLYICLLFSRDPSSIVQALIRL